MSTDKPAKPDFRVLVTLKDDSLTWRTLSAKATIVYLNEKGEVRSPNFDYRPDGIGEYEGLCITGQISSYERKIDADDFYGHRGLTYMDLYSVTLTHAEAMVKVLRRIESRLEKANEKFGSTDFAGNLARFADAIGAHDRYPLGIYERGQCFPTTGTEYRWMDTDGLRFYLRKQIEQWMEKHGLSRKEAS